jgi:hypothetical protein
MNPRIVIGEVKSEIVVPIADSIEPVLQRFHYVAEIDVSKSPRVHLGRTKTTRSNEWYPTPAEFREFTDFVGITYMFFDGERLRKERGQPIRLMGDHLVFLKRVRKAFQEKHPNARLNTSSRVIRDRHYQRLNWLIWWCEHALRTVNNPGIILH